MKSMSIRTRILAGVVLVNLVGAIVVMVYLHESFSKGLDGAATQAMAQAVAGWEQLAGAGGRLDPLKSQEKIAQTLERMSAITGTQYGFLLEKDSTNAQAYAASREKQNLPNNWDEGDAYAVLASTDAAAADRMRFAVPPGDVPETGKIVGVENGACSATCHNSVAGRGDYWGVRWSPDSKTRAHAIFPVNDAGGQPIGVVYAIEDLSRLADADRTSMLRTLVVVGITLLVATLLIGGLMDALVLRRLARMTASMEDIGLRVAGGDYDAHFAPDGTSDEIGGFEDFFARLMDVISMTLKQLSQTKGGQG